MENELKDIFKNVNNWLKFAEAKNATIVAGNGFVIFAIFRIIKDASINEYLQYYIYFCILMLSLSFVIALMSFIPNVKLPAYIFNNSQDKSNNLLFFGSIMEYDEDTYLKELKEALELNEYKEKKIDTMYANQIIINSQIAMKKFRFFNIALHLTLIAVLSPLILLFFIC